MVDSMPTSLWPPSSTGQREPSAPNSSRTCWAVVGLTWPNLLADGAATPPLPPLKACSRRIATGCDGQRMPTVSWPPETASGMFGARFRIMVSGPGQKASAS
jgi:hypothetical protein